MSVGEFLWGAFSPAIGFIAAIIVIIFLSEQAKNKRQKKMNLRKDGKQNKKKRSAYYAKHGKTASRRTVTYFGNFLFIYPLKITSLNFACDILLNINRLCLYENKRI